MSAIRCDNCSAVFSDATVLIKHMKTECSASNKQLSKPESKTINTTNNYVINRNINAIVLGKKKLNQDDLEEIQKIVTANDTLSDLIPDKVTEIYDSDRYSIYAYLCPDKK